MGLKWRVKSWFSCLKLPTKLRSWKSRDKMSSTEMVGTEHLLSWDLSRLSSVSSFPSAFLLVPVCFAVDGAGVLDCPQLLRMSVFGRHEAVIPHGSFLGTASLPSSSARSGWVLVFHCPLNCSWVLPLYPRTLNF